MEEVKSPCKLICRYNDGICTGCFRTLNEIENWSKYSNKEKLKVLENIEKRKPQQNYYGDPI